MSEQNPLLIKRDETILVPLEGKVEVDTDVPEPLRTGCYVVRPELVTLVKSRSRDDDLVITSENGMPVVANADQIEGVWSGYRSVLVQTGTNGQKKLYKLKGVSFNPSEIKVEHYDDKTHEIWGAQPAYSAQFERKMSNRFNVVLESEGITPVMKHKGFWRYSTKVGREKLTASVVEVQGDTRLDELLFVLENWLWLRTEGEPMNWAGHAVHSRFFELAEVIGYRVGQLKRLMDKNNQTWSSAASRSNAHIGNIVVYRDDYELRIGFVDFDASCDTNDFSLSEIKDLQKKENDFLCQSALEGPISLRSIGYLTGMKTIIFPDVRKKFAAGFSIGYNANSKIIENCIGARTFLEIVRDMRSAIDLRVRPHISYIEELLERNLRSFLYQYQNPISNRDILLRHQQYQSLSGLLDSDDKYQSLSGLLDSNDTYQPVKYQI